MSDQSSKSRPPHVLIAILVLLILGLAYALWRIGLDVLRSGLKPLPAETMAFLLPTGSAFPWGMVIVGGPVLLGLAMAWGAFQASRRTRRIDPDTPADDPSRGMD